MKHYHRHEFFLRVFLLVMTVLFGAGMFFVMEHSADSAYARASASTPLSERDYSVPLPSVPHDWLPAPLSLHDTEHMVGGWGCRLRANMPYSILGFTQCF